MAVAGRSGSRRFHFEGIIRGMDQADQADQAKSSGEIIDAEEVD